MCCKNENETTRMGKEELRHDNKQITMQKSENNSMRRKNEERRRDDYKEKR